MGFLIVLIAALVLGFVMMHRWNSDMPWHIGGSGSGSGSGSGGTTVAKPPIVAKPTVAQQSAAYVPWTGDHLSGIKSIGSKHMVTNTQDPSTLGLVRHNHLFASKRSRLRALADPIRGDLPIVPEQGDWKPSVKPHVDLHPGSLNVLTGHNNALGQQMAHLVHTSSGGSERQIGGISF